MPEDVSRRTPRRSKTKKKRNQPAANNTVNRTVNDDRQRTGQINTFNRLDQDNGQPLAKVPSNSPTMAIAPSDYEHIFHEAAPGTNSPAPVHSPPAPAPIAVPRELPMPTSPSPSIQRTRTPDVAVDDYRQLGHSRYAVEVQVTPDGYTLLGHQPDMSATRRQALPPHIVRASNQFSRAALARIARYLATRADGPNR